MQEPVGDGDPTTSDAIIVFTSSIPAVQVGDLVSVSGIVTEFTPGGVSTRNLATTEIINPIVQVVSSGNPLPAPVVIGPGGRPLPTESMVAGIQFFESLEGMLVTATRLQVVEPTNGFGEIFTFLGQGTDFNTSNTGRSIRGTINIGPNDFNPEKVQIDPSAASGSGFVTPVVNVGSILGNLTGVVDFNFGNYEIVPIQPLEVIQAVTPPKTTISPATDPLTLSIGTFNVLNLDPNDADGDTDIADGRFASIATIIATNMNGPDVVGLQEIQDNSGSVNDGTISASATLQRLVDAIAVVNPSLQYSYIDNPFIGSETNGGQPGGNIRTAYLYNPSRIGATGILSPIVNATDQRTNTSNPFYESRLPLASKFIFLPNGKVFEVVNNHFSSKGGSAPIMGTAQPFEALQENTTVNGSVENRKAQSKAIQAYVTGKTNTIVLGDFNEFEFVSPVADLGNIMTLLTNSIPPNERYSYIFQGNSQAIDHILISNDLSVGATAEYIHVNCEYTETDKSRASDHDPMVARIDGRLLQVRNTYKLVFPIISLFLA
jgi:predicted extracellular nuclease